MTEYYNRQSFDSAFNQSYFNISYFDLAFNQSYFNISYFNSAFNQSYFNISYFSSSWFNFLDDSALKAFNDLEYTFGTYGKIYLINLDTEKDRLEKATNHFKEADIDFTRIPAINGLEIEIENIETGEVLTGQLLKDSGFKTKANTEYKINYPIEESMRYLDDPLIHSYKFFGPPMSAGEFGVIASNREVWALALDKSLDIAVIFEDDVKFLDVTNASDQLYDCLTHVPNNFDVLFCGYNQVSGARYPLEGNDYVSAAIGNFSAYGMYTVVYSSKGMEKLLAYEYYTDALDNFIWKEASYTDPNKLIVYVSERKIVDIDWDLPSSIDAMGRAGNCSTTKMIGNYTDFLYNDTIHA